MRHIIGFFILVGYLWAVPVLASNLGVFVGQALSK